MAKTGTKIEYVMATSREKFVEALKLLKELQGKGVVAICQPGDIIAYEPDNLA